MVEVIHWENMSRLELQKLWPRNGRTWLLHTRTLVVGVLWIWTGRRSGHGGRQFFWVGQIPPCTSCPLPFPLSFLFLPPLSYPFLPLEVGPQMQLWFGEHCKLPLQRGLWSWVEPQRKAN